MRTRQITNKGDLLDFTAFMSLFWEYYPQGDKTQEMVELYNKDFSVIPFADLKLAWDRIRIKDNHRPSTAAIYSEVRLIQAEQDNHRRELANRTKVYAHCQDCSDQGWIYSTQVWNGMEYSGVAKCKACDYWVNELQGIKNRKEEKRYKVPPSIKKTLDEINTKILQWPTTRPEDYVPAPYMTDYKPKRVE